MYCFIAFTVHRNALVVSLQGNFIWETFSTRYFVSNNIVINIFCYYNQLLFKKSLITTNFLHTVAAKCFMILLVETMLIVNTHKPQTISPTTTCAYNNVTCFLLFFRNHVQFFY